MTSHDQHLMDMAEAHFEENPFLDMNEIAKYYKNIKNKK